VTLSMAMIASDEAARDGFHEIIVRRERVTPGPALVADGRPGSYIVPCVGLDTPQTMSAEAARTVTPRPLP